LIAVLTNITFAETPTIPDSRPLTVNFNFVRLLIMIHKRFKNLSIAVGILTLASLFGISKAAAGARIDKDLCGKFDRDRQLVQVSGETSDRQTARSDLQRIFAGRAWIKERTEKYPHRVIIQLRENSEIQIISTEFESKNTPFFKFEIQIKNGRSFIVPLNATLRGHVLPKIPYRLAQDKDSLIIESGTVIAWDRGVRKDINLQGEYTAWLPTKTALKPK
jgi:hypothetical protein